jgi:hypothetical protein
MFSNGLPLSNYECALFERAAAWPEHQSWTELTEAELRQLALSHGHDFAVALLYDRLRRSTEHGPFIRSVESLEHSWPRPRAHLAIVPGAFYHERPETGADGRRLVALAARLGCRAECIPVASFGSVGENAGILQNWLIERRQQRFVLVSLSKGSLDVRAALRPPEAQRTFGNVIAWVNLSGLFQGTELVAWLKRRPWRSMLVWIYCWWRSYRWSILAELQRCPGRVAALPLPEQIPLVHVLGFPLCRHLSSPLARRAFARLTPLGPNDGGGNLLADALGWPGVIFPVWGADHYLRPNWDVDDLLARLLGHLLSGEPVPIRSCVA